MECVLCGKISLDRNDDFCSEECKMNSQHLRFNIVRHFYEDHLPSKIIKRGLTLAEAKAWCGDPETASKTAKGKKARAILIKYGEWYDGYAEEKNR